MVEQNKQLQEHLKQVKLQNEALAKRKVELTQELKRAKEDLSSLIEKGEHQKSAFLKEIAAVKEQERKLADQRDRERRAFEEQERANQRRIQQLNEALRRREADIEGARKQLSEINDREALRMEELEREAQFFKNILKQY